MKDGRRIIARQFFRQEKKWKMEMAVEEGEEAGDTVEEVGKAKGEKKIDHVEETG